MATAIYPAVAPVFLNGALPDDFALHIPRDAYTLAGFRRWVHSDAFPEKQPVLFLNGEITVKKDLIDLKAAYHKANVNEYWIIDARGDNVEFHILHWRKTGYVAAPRKAGWQRSRIFGRSFRLTRVRDRATTGATPWKSRHRTTDPSHDRLRV